MHGHVGDGLPVEKNIPCVRPNQPDYHIKAGGFPRAVGPKQTDDFAAVNAQGNAVDDAPFVVGLFEGFSGE